MKVLVTGSQGFVGRALHPVLRQAGHTVLASHESPDSEVPLRLSWPRDVMIAILTSTRPDVIIHLAAQSSVRESWRNPEATLHTNLMGSLNLFLAAQHTGVPRIIVMSSAEVYAPSLDPLSETSPLAPRNPYGTSKLAMEQLLQQMSQTSPLQYVIVRAFNLTGPGQRPDFVVADWASQLANMSPDSAGTLLVGDLTTTRDFLDVRDAVQALRLMMEDSTPSGVYNLCSGEGRSLHSIVEDLQAVSGIPHLTLTPDPLKHRPSETPHLVGTSARLHMATGWLPQIPWRQTVSDLIQSLRPMPH